MVMAGLNGKTTSNLFFVEAREPLTRNVRWLVCDKHESSNGDLCCSASHSQHRLTSIRFPDLLFLTQ